MLLCFDGFDHYGTGATGRTNMLRGPYASFSSNVQPQTAAARNGLAGLQMPPNSSWRRVLPASANIVGYGVACYLASLPDANDWVRLMEFMDASNNVIGTLNVGTDGRLQFRIGNYGTLVAESGPLTVLSSTFHHVECRVDFNGASASSVECRVDGSVTAFSETGITLGSAACSAVGGRSTSSGAPTLWFDDLFVWEGAGGGVDDFIGDHGVDTGYASADTAVSDWTRNTGSNDFEMIDDTTPDDDATYVEATTPGDTSDYEITALPAEVSAVTAVQTVGLLRKTDAGTCDGKISLISSSASPAGVAAGTDRPIVEAYSYTHLDIHELDPATGTPWTPTSRNDAILEIERTA